MHHVAPTESLPDRSSRAPFKYPVRVTIAGSRVVRVLSGDLSLSGMFLVMPEPPESGTVVTLAFEAGGRVLPFAEGEVAWRRSAETRGGFGVRFTRFLHPRAGALIDFLCENVESGSSLKPQPPPRNSPRRWSGLAALAAVATFLVTTGSAPPQPQPVTLDPSLVCRADATACPEAVAAAPKKAVAKKPVLARLPEAPRPAPVVTRTLFTAAKPASLSSTAIPSGAARLVTVSRVSGSMRVAVDPVAGGLVTQVRALQNPPRLVIDVSGIAPVADHLVRVSDPELLRIVARKNGKGTRLTLDLARQPSKVIQQGDTALISY